MFALLCDLMENDDCINLQIDISVKVLSVDISPCNRRNMHCCVEPFQKQKTGLCGVPFIAFSAWTSIRLLFALRRFVCQLVKDIR